MHPEAREAVRKIRDKYPEAFQYKTVLEIGSLDINGSVRHLFKSCAFMGLNITPGPGVNFVGSLSEFTDQLAVSETHSYDTVFSTEVLEHSKDWRTDIEDMWINCKPGGLVFFTCATTGRAEHGTHGNSPSSSPGTNDHYQNITQQMLEEVINFEKYFKEWEFSINHESYDLYFYGITKNIKP
jgi:hypothetical protein